MRSILIIIVCLGCLQFSAEAFNDKKLEKLYTRNPDKCELYAKKIIKKNTKEAVPYYYLTIINSDKCRETIDVKKAYTFLNKSMTYAEKFEKYSSESIRDAFQWDAKLALLEEYYIDVIGRLEVADLNDKAGKLALRHSKLTGAPLTNNEKENTTASEKKEYPSEVIDGRYFGKPTGLEVVKSSSETEEQKLITILNAARKAKGLTPLIWNEDLARAARYHAYDMATQKYFSHNSFDRKNEGATYQVAGTFDRIKMFYKSSFVNSENIAAGNGTAEETYQQWFNSPGHYANMFESKSRLVGLGMYADPSSPFKYYWVFCTAQ